MADRSVGRAVKLLEIAIFVVAGPLIVAQYFFNKTDIARHVSCRANAVSDYVNNIGAFSKFLWNLTEKNRLLNYSDRNKGINAQDLGEASATGHL
jgi:hypothetical protein